MEEQEKYYVQVSREEFSEKFSFYDEPMTRAEVEQALLDAGHTDIVWTHPLFAIAKGVVDGEEEKECVHLTHAEEPTFEERRDALEANLTRLYGRLGLLGPEVSR